MAEYGSNKVAVRFQRNIVDEPLPETKSQEMPMHRPMVGGYMPGGKETPLPGRRRAGPKDLPWRSWLDKGKSTRKRKKNRIASLMG
jgi:hypothetical protein